VNDVLGGRPVSVTYCNVLRSSRAFAGEPGGAPLEIGVGGWINRGLALRVGGEDYAQMTGECLSRPSSRRIPYEEYPHVRSTWKAWREAHPDTDVYVDPPFDEGPASRPGGQG